MNATKELKRTLSINKLLFISAYSPLLLIIAIKTSHYKIKILLNNVLYEIPIVSIIFVALFIIFIFISYKI